MKVLDALRKWVADHRGGRRRLPVQPSESPGTPTS